MSKKSEREERLESAFVQGKHRLLQAVRRGELGSLGNGMLDDESRAAFSVDFEELRKGTK